MAKRAKLDDLELLAAIEAASQDAIGSDANDVVADRADALDRYFGRPYGDEVEGRSAVVSKDLSDTIDWIMASLLRIFAGGDSVVQFTPVGPEDEAAAQQETDYVNYVVTQENPWAIVAHDAMKDALMLRNGYLKTYWEDYTRPVYSSYTGLTVDQLPLVVDEDDEVVEQREREEDGATVYDVKVRSYDEGGKVCVEAVPPEELLVHRSCRAGIGSSMYVEHKPPKTRSDLVEMGLPEDFVEGLPSYSDDNKYNADALARNPTQSEDEAAGAYHQSMERVDYREVYIRLDYDGDGVAELRRVVVCGNKIPPGSEWNREVDCIPFASLSPNRIPHRHVGRSVMDEVEDIARIKTTLWRQMLDNIYLTNNQRTVVSENVNLSDMLVSRPGGLIRTKGIPGQDVFPLMTAPIMQQVLPAFEYVDGVKESRTGVGRNSMGLDANTLRESTKGAYLAAMGQANQKVEMIARMFSETGIRDLFLQVHGLLLKHQDKEKVVRLRGSFVPVDPSTWKTRYDLTVSVGLGTGSTEEQVQKVMALAQGQAQLAPFGLVGPKEAFESFSVGAKALGFKNPEKFAMNPSSPEYQQMMQSKQPQKDPLVAAKEVETQGKIQLEAAKSQAEQPQKLADMELRKYEIDKRNEVELMKAQAASAQAAADRAAEQRIAELCARVDLTIAQMDARIAQVGQMVKVVGDAQNRMALGGPANSATVDVGEGEGMAGPSMADLFTGLQQTQMALAGGLNQLAQGQQEMAQMMLKPKQIAIQRDKDGKAVSATSKVV